VASSCAVIAVTYSTTNYYDFNFWLQMQSSSSGTKTWYRYDGAGSTRMERTTSASVQADSNNASTSAERAAYYSADDRLIASDVRRSGRRTLEEYRYDALGRRTWVSTRVQCAGNPQIAECLTSAVRRVLWDGPQELAEIQAPYDAFANAPVGSEELDAAMPLLPRSTCAGPNPCDPNPFYGQVVYAPGLALDQPLGVTRFRYQDNTGSSSLQWPTFTQTIFWNARGTPAYGLFENGAESRPFALAGGQTACSLVSNGTDRCVLTQWPFAQNAYDRARGKLVWASWSGSLLRNKVDGTGLEYMRNRVYDSQSGRFTQEDPIGLAGGLNLYGFAGGDPANFSDPFGLCPACIVVALRAAPYVFAGAKLVAEMLDPNPNDLGSAVVAGGSRALRAAKGSYEITFESGMKYVGKGGGAERALASARRLFKETGDRVTGINFKQAVDDADAFVDEAKRMEAAGGLDKQKLYNKVNSPGKKIDEARSKSTGSPDK
jgi:RHS repeat-associated protein